ncbi:MAG: two-component regulator propeller domain-containing protein [Bryobacteraceae bacterium]
MALPLLCWASIALYARNAGTDPHLSQPISAFHQNVWKTEQGLPQNTVPAIVQSTDGYLWTGTELGLVRFDGLHFTVFDKSNTPELKSNVVDSLLADSKGNLWIGTIGGGLTRLSKGQFHTFTKKDGLSSDSVLTLLEDTSGDLWIGTNGGGLNRLHNGRFSTYATGDGLANDEVFALAQDPRGNIWAGTHDGLSRISNGSIRNYGTANGLPNSYVRSLCVTAQGDLWIGTYGGGLSRFDDGVFRTFTTKDGLSSNSVVSLREDSDGSLWIGTLAGGLTRLSGTDFSSYTSRNGLASNDVWAIYEDRDRNLWIGTGGGGLTRLSNKTPFTTYGKKDGLSNEVTLPVYEDHAGSLWVGTNGGGLNCFRNGKFRAFTTRDGLADDLVFTVGEDHEGALWIGTRRGLNRLKDGRFTTYTKKDGLPSDAVFATLTDHEGTVWIGTRAGLGAWKDHKFKTYTTKDGLSSNVVQAIYEDRERNLWVGTADGGLDRLKDGRFEVFDTRSGLSNNFVLSIYEDAHNDLWVGTNGGGLNRLKAGRFSVYTTKDGLLDDAIFRILEDNSGNLWMSSNKGIFRASIHALNAFGDKKIDRVPAIVYGTADGMDTRECNGGFQPAGWKAHDGRLWFPTMQGLVVVDPRKLAANVSQQPVVIEQVFINRHEVNPLAEVRVPQGAGELEFHYSAPNFRSAERINFKYKLEGFNPNWIEAGGRRIAYYTNIPPGEYRFQVIASNEDGTWSSIPSSFAFRFEPHFYQTFAFYGLCVFALAGLITAAHLAHVRQLRERERVLEQRVDERTAELRDEIAERERVELESVKAKLAAEKASRVKSEFLANMSHEIRTPMNGILGMTNLALATDLTAEQKQYLEIIQDSAGSLLTVIDDILDFSKVEAGKLDLDPIDFDLRECLASAMKSMAFRADQKALRLVYDVDPDVPELVKADPVRLRQIILNLLGNAIKFTEKGEVALEVACEAENASGAALHFIVRDTGIGIPLEKLTSIFDAFSQADSSTTRKFGGTGLGLAICNRLVQLMGGKIWAESELGRGSAFHFTVNVGAASAPVPAEPVRPAATIMEPISATHEDTKVPALRVLLAEDNPANRMVARLTLEQAGFHVHEVENGRDALDAALRIRFDVILMDCRMPVMDGYEAAAQIRQSPGPGRRVPIIALTASAFKEDRERAEQAGMDDFVIKPFHGKELIFKCLALTTANSDVRDVSSLHDAIFNRQPTPEGFTSMQSPEFFTNLIEIFLETAPPVFENLRRAVEHGSWDEAKKSAHWLQGGATKLIDPNLQQQLQQTEQACAGVPPAISAPEFASLEASFKSACKAAEGWLSESGPRPSANREEIPAS